MGPKVSAGQAVQAALPAAEKKPGEQDAQLALLAEEEKLPAEQATQFAPLMKFPGAQEFGVQAELPALEPVPGGQALQPALPTTEEKVLAGQAVQLVASAAEEKLPTGQGWQPLPEMKVPAAQPGSTPHCLATVWPGDKEKVSVCCGPAAGAIDRSISQFCGL